MVKVDGDGDIGKTDRGLDEFFEIDGMGIFACDTGNLEHDGRLFFFAGFDDGLEQFHVVDVESADGVFGPKRLGEQVSGVRKRHRLSTQVSLSSPDNLRYKVARLPPSRSAAFSLSPPQCCRARLR